MKTAVLTFDDGLLCHYSVVAPKLLKRGFGATFFIRLKDKKLKVKLMGIARARILHDKGFEIGNHTVSHYSLNIVPVDVFCEDVVKLEQKFEDKGIPKPVTFAFPGFIVNDRVIEFLKKRGYIAARSGCEQAGTAFDNGWSGKVYRHGDSLYPLNCTGIFGPKYGYNEFERDLSKIKDGEVGIFCFHNIGKPLRYKIFNESTISENVFTMCLDLLGKKGFVVISLKDMVNGCLVTKI